MPDLKDLLRRRRAGKRPEPWTFTPFAVVGGLVQEGHLGEDCLSPAEPRSFSDLAALFPGGEPRPKPAWQPPLFPLLTPEAYRLTERLLAQLGNPYLGFARDQDEVRLSLFLYRRRPDLAPELLRHLHFATLLALEFLRAEVRDLEPAKEWDEMETEHAVRLAAAWRRLARWEARVKRLGLHEGVPKS